MGMTCLASGKATPHHQPLTERAVGVASTLPSRAGSCERREERRLGVRTVASVEALRADAPRGEGRGPQLRPCGATCVPTCGQGR